MDNSLSATIQKQYNYFFSSVKIISDFTKYTEVRLASKLAPKFNYFDLFAPKENKISSILCDLLSPSGRHGQGDRFLGEFFKGR